MLRCLGELDVVDKVPSPNDSLHPIVRLLPKKDQGDGDASTTIIAKLLADSTEALWHSGEVLVATWCSSEPWEYLRDADESKDAVP
jgi:hypothetical protein